MRICIYKSSLAQNPSAQRNLGFVFGFLSLRLGSTCAAGDLPFEVEILTAQTYIRGFRECDTVAFKRAVIMGGAGSGSNKIGSSGHPF